MKIVCSKKIFIQMAKNILLEDEEPKILTGDVYSTSGIVLTVVFDTRRSKANGLYNIKYRVTFMRKQVYYSSGIDLSKEEWYSMPTTRKRDLIEHRELIQDGFDNIKKNIIELVKSDGFTTDKLNTRLSKGMKNSIISAFHSKIEALEQAGRIGSAIMYGCTIRSIEKFTKKDIKFNEVTKDWLQRYESHLTDLKRSYTTIGMYMRSLRAIINEGKKQGIITEAQYPFRDYKIPTGEGRKIALTLKQIGEVLKYPLVTETDMLYRDIWFFSYLCNGINVADLLKLRYSNIVNGEILWYRQKTIRTEKRKKEIAATLLPQMQLIIDKWGNTEKRPNNYIFPFLKEGLSPREEKRITQNLLLQINKCMHKIGMDLNLGNITTYVARHSYATILKRSGANIAFISESLGHSDQKTTESYLDSFEKEERQKNAELLTKFD